jgi:hypothetical protein
MTSVLENVRTFLMTYSGLKYGAPFSVDFLGSNPPQYSIQSLPGERVLEWYVDDSSLRVFPFALQWMGSTADHIERINNDAFAETFADWLETQWRAGTMPTLGTGKTSHQIEATSWGYLEDQGQSETGVYMILCRLIYKQDNP